MQALIEEEYDDDDDDGGEGGCDVGMCCLGRSEKFELRTDIVSAVAGMAAPLGK